MGERNKLIEYLGLFSISSISPLIAKLFNFDWIAIIGVIGSLISLLLAFQQVIANFNKSRMEKEEELNEKLNAIERKLKISIDKSEHAIEILEERTTDLAAKYNSHISLLGHDGTLREVVEIRERLAQVSTIFELIYNKERAIKIHE